MEREKGNMTEGEFSGYLCLKRSWPSTFRTLCNDQERYETTNFEPYLAITGDGCTRDKDGYHWYWLTRRVDDVIYVSGHRIGITEVEYALASHPQCAEAIVVGIELSTRSFSTEDLFELLENLTNQEFRTSTN